VATESIIQAGGGDFTSAQAWINTHNNTTLTQQQVGQIQDTATYDEHLTFTSITTTASFNMVLSVSAANRAKGVSGTGAILKPSDAGQTIISAGANHFVVEHLEIHPGTATSNECLRASTTNQTMESCLCIGRGQGVAPFQQDGIHCTNINATVNVHNCMFQNFSRSGAHCFMGITDTATFNIKNVSIINCGNLTGGNVDDQASTGGLDITTNVAGATVTFNCDNVISMANISGDTNEAFADFADGKNTGTNNWNGSGNISSDASATNKFGATNNLDNATLTTNVNPGAGVFVVMTNITVGSENQHLKSSSANQAQNASSSITFVDTTGTFTDDIDGDLRSAALMDGGADQISFAVMAKSGGRSSGPRLQTLKEFTTEEQVTLYHARQRRLSLNDVMKGMFRTLFLPLTPAAHSSALWPTRNTLYTIVAEIDVTAAAAAGVIFEIGSTVQGAGITMSAGALFAFAGNNGTDGVDVTFTPAVGRRLWVALAISPGNGKIALYIDGKLQVRGTSSSGNFTSGLWALAGTGAGIGQVDGTHNSRVTSVNTLSNVSMVSPVSFFSGQVPRGFLG